MTAQSHHRPQVHSPDRPSRRAFLGGAAVAALAVATGTGTASAASAAPRAASWPTEFPLPDGFLPEGITIGAEPYAYMGSRADGAVYRTDLRTGEGRVIHEGGTGLVSVGMKLDHDGLQRVHGVSFRTGAVNLWDQLGSTMPSSVRRNDEVSSRTGGVASCTSAPGESPRLRGKPPATRSARAATRTRGSRGGSARSGPGLTGTDA